MPLGSQQCDVNSDLYIMSPMFELRLLCKRIAGLFIVEAQIDIGERISQTLFTAMEGRFKVSRKSERNCV